jgi:hypothetical protein
MIIERCTAVDRLDTNDARMVRKERINPPSAKTS